MKITKLQLDTIVKNAPAGIDAQYIQEGLIEKGYEIEGVDTMAAKTFIAQKKAGIIHPADMPQQEDQPIEPVVPKQNTGLLKSVKNFGNSIGDALYAGKASKMAEENQQQHDEYLQKLTNRQKEMKLAGQDTSRIEAVMKNMLQDDPQNYGADVATIIPSINKNTKQIVGEGLGVLTDLLVTTGGLGAVAGGGAMMGTSAMQDNKSAGKIATDTAIGMIGGKILEVGFNKVSPYVEKVVATYGTPLLEKLTQYIPESALPKLQELAQKATIGSGTGGTDVLNKVNSLAEAPLNMATDAVGGALSKARVAVSKPNVADSLETSVDRLKSSKLSKESPVDTYNRYVNQEKKLKVDAKETDALGLVGSEDLGPAIDNVIKQRRDAGAVMESEMKKVGATKVSLTDQFPAFEKSLADNGVMMKGKKFVSSRTSKLTDQDIKLINEYVVKLNKLGANPTAAELDAFLSKVPKDLEVYAGANNLLKTTNGMRMIQQNLGEMSGALSGKANPAFKTFAEAKSKYSDLSNFLKDNQSLFGKKNSKGDYIKDVSTLKAAIRSSLGGNKKDFLLKLEELTGQPIVDKTVLALQAMKDMGNAQGSSLLDILMPNSKMSIPTSPEGIIGKGVDMITSGAKKAFVGSPESQTRRVIQSRLGSESKVVVPVKKNGIMSSDLSTGVKKAFNNAKDTLKTLKDKNVRERGSISLESILPESKSVRNQGVSLTNNTTEDLVQQARKYKSAEEFIKNTIPSYGKPPGNPLYHGTSANIKSGKLTFGAGDGAKKGGQSGGHFLSDSKQVSEVFAGNNGKVYIVDPSYKKNILDLTQPKGVKEFENYIGNKYKTYDGESLEFTKDDFDIMFPNGKTDFASISQYPELVEQMTKRKGYTGIAFDEYAGGNTAKTYQILHSDNIPVIEQSKISNSDLSRLIKEKIKAETDATDLRLEEYGRNQDGYLTDSQIEELDYLEKRIREIDNILLSSDYKSQLEEIWKKANKK